MKLAIPRLAIPTVLMLLVSLPTMAQKGSYDIKPLPLPTGSYSGYPISVNSANEVVGSYLSDTYGSTPTRHTFYLNSTSSQTLDGQATSVMFINNLGKITSAFTGGVFYGAPGTGSLLPGQPSGSFAQAGVTDGGFAALTTSDSLYRYHNGELLKLATFSPNQFNKTMAKRANDNGYVVGSNGGFAAYWNPDGTLVQVGKSGGNSSATVTFSQLVDINLSNTYLGYQQMQAPGGGTSTMALLGSPGVTALQQIPIDVGVGLNDAGKVVGTKGTGTASDPTIGILFDSKTSASFNLNDLLVSNPGWTGLIPTAIASKSDSIVGYGMLNGVQTPFIMQKAAVAASYTFSAYWPEPNATISGKQRFKAAIQVNGKFDNTANQVFWRVNQGQWNLVTPTTFTDNTGHTQPDYEVDVDVSSWFLWMVPDVAGNYHVTVNFIVQEKVHYTSVIQPDIPLNISK